MLLRLAHVSGRVKEMHRGRPLCCAAMFHARWRGLSYSWNVSRGAYGCGMHAPGGDPQTSRETAPASGGVPPSSCDVALNDK